MWTTYRMWSPVLKLRLLMENKLWCNLQNIPLPSISCTCSSQSWCACWSGLGMCHTFFNSQPTASCWNKTHSRKKEHTAASRQISSLDGQIPNYQVVVVVWEEPLRINNFLREITDIFICAVAQSPHSHSRFPHLSLIIEREKGWWKTGNVLGTRVCVAQHVFWHSRNPCTDRNYQREKMPWHLSHIQCVGEPQRQLKYSTVSRCLYYSRHT